MFHLRFFCGAFGRKVLLGSAVMCLLIGTSLAEQPEPQYLSTDLADRMSSVIQGWGELGIDTSVKPGPKPAMKLRIKDKEYQHGLGHHAPGEITIDLAGQFQSFHTDVGIQWQGGSDAASVVFCVLVDGKKVFDSGVMREGDAPRSVDVPVRGAEELTLIAEDAGDGITCDCANWADARLIPDPTAMKRPPILGLDVAAFGQVVTWDPQRLEGTAANRVEEFPADDIRMYREVQPESDGSYVVPVYGGRGCIGLRWDENRMLRQVALSFADAAAIPPQESIQLQTWSGESAWQGKWEPCQLTPELAENRLVWNFRPRDAARGTQKVRWVFSDMPKPVILKGLQAHSRSRSVTVDLRVEAVRPASHDPIAVVLYNGSFIEESPSQEGFYQRTWDPSRPLTLRVRAAATKRYKADRTVLQFSGPGLPFGVAVEDLLSHDCVYVAHAGVFLVREPAPVTCSEYLQKIAGGKTLLSHVRQQPDQTFAQAMDKVHNPIQDLGPTMLSLACDNRKFVAMRDGSMVFDLYTKGDGPELPIPTQWQLVPRFGSGKDQQLSRRLAKTWLPMPTTFVTDGDLTYASCAYVAPLDDEASQDRPVWFRQRAVGVVEYSVRNGGSEELPASLALMLTAGEGNTQQVTWQKQGAVVVATLGNRLVAMLDVGQLEPADLQIAGPTITLSGKLPAGDEARCTAYIPAWPATPTDAQVLVQAAPDARRLEAYWNKVLEPAAQITLPDELLTQVIRASEVHCLLAARNEDEGRRVSAWISSDRYGPLESEANSIIRGMGLMGHDEFAQRSFDYFIARYNKAGYLTTGYTMVGTGEHLWTLAEHHQRVQDDQWLTAVAPQLARVCQWIVAQRAKTKLTDSQGTRVPEYGLFPPGVTADWNRYAYRFFNDAQYCAGLETAARMLAAIQYPGADRWLEDAEQYRNDLLRAYRATQARSPVVQLGDGTWGLPDPALLDCPGRVEDFLPGEDGNRSWAYSVELGAHHLAATRVLDPAGSDVGTMMDYLEESQFLRSGMGDYPEARNRQDPFNLGGFAKVQPYYGRFAEVYAARDDVKPFVRAYFNAIPSLLCRENLSFWEHFHNMGGWNKTHETGWFLCQSRLMLVQERGHELWLAPFATSNWLQDGQIISVQNAPTDFGRVSFQIESAIKQNNIQAEIQPPVRQSPERIVLRLRHPDGKPIRAVTVDGQPHQSFDVEEETITLLPTKSPIRVRVEY